MTSFLDRILGRPEPRTAKAVTALGGWANAVPLSLLNEVPQDKAKAYLRAYKVGWFYKAGSKIADDVSSLDWSVSDGDAEEGEDETTIPKPKMAIPFDALSPVDQFQRLLERPNPTQTGRQLLRKTEVRLDFAGAAAWYLEGGKFGLPTALYGISPARMWPSYDKAGNLIGWVMDRDSPSGGTPFEVEEILWFSTGNAGDDDIWGTSIVEAVYSQVPITDMVARHTSNVLTTGGRLAGMMWPKERGLSEDEFLDAQRAWRNVASDPDAGKRLLIFPEPMEYAQGASTPAEIGIPELSILNRDEILTAFPVSPYRLGVPAPGGLNSGEVRREDRRDYWEETIHPRADLLKETIQTGLLSRYEEIEGRALDFDLLEPNLDDAPTLIEKVGAYKGLVSVGFDGKEAVKAVGLDHIKWLGLPDLLDPAKQAAAAAEAAAAKPESSVTVAASDTSRRDNSTTQVSISKAVKALADQSTEAGTAALTAFLDEQRDRVVASIQKTMPRDKAARKEAHDDWWDADLEDAALRTTLRGLYLEVGKGGLQTAADTLGRIVPNKAVGRILDDLLAYGGTRITAINETTRNAITDQIAEGARRGYSINQLIEGVPSEAYPGVQKALLDNGVEAFDAYRAEVIARTETMLSYNRAAIRGYGEFGVKQVTAIDGDGDAECAARVAHGPYPIEEALGIEDHPNGTLDWIPVLGEKSVHEPTTHISVEPHISVTMPGMTFPEPVITVTNQLPAPSVTVQNDVKVPTVTVNNEVVTPSVTVEAPNVNVTNEVVSPSVHVTNEVKTPEVNVTNKVATPQVNVTNEVVTPSVHVTNDVKTPDVHVTNEVVTPTVNVSPAEVTVNLPKSNKTIVRDAEGRISGVTDGE